MFVNVDTHVLCNGMEGETFGIGTETAWKLSIGCSKAEMDSKSLNQIFSFQRDVA